MGFWPSAILALSLGPVEFAEPLWLAGLLLLIPIVYLWKTSRVPDSALRRHTALALRCVLVVALVGAMADVRMVWFNKGICVTFVLDQSQSVPGDAREKVRALIKREVDLMSKDDRFAVVEFGGDAVLGVLPSPRGELPAPATVGDSGRTNLARAIRLAMASFPADRQKRIVLFSDGNQNQEDALREARIAGFKDVDILVVPILTQRGHEVMVDQVIVPPNVRKGARFMIRTLVTSNVPQEVEVIISRNGQPFARLPREQLKTGANVIDVPDILSDGGAHQYQVTISPLSRDHDTFAANNTGYTLTRVDAPGKVLLVRGLADDSDHLAGALASSGIDLVTIPSSAFPATPEQFTPYDCVILDNVSRFEIGAPVQLNSLRQWVKDYGGGLVLIGGDDSFGPGGYTATALEELSPVEMDVKRKKHLASLAIVAVLDKSGSMGMPVDAGGKAQKIDLANEGACEILKLLDDQDLAMIGHCDTQVRWVDNHTRLLPMFPGNKASLISGTRTVRSGGGGIYCLTSLEHSYGLIKHPSVQTMTKHVIMFADAQDSEQQANCVQMARTHYLSFGITTSVIGMGIASDIHAPFLKAVADAGNGRFMITDDVRNLPKLFMKEAFLVSRQAFVEDPKGITPAPYNSPLLQGFITDGKASLPSIYGYVGTTLKPRATLALHGKQADDPLLAHWVVGLGKCVAYTSDTTSRWGKDWVSWDGYAKFWAQVVRWASRSPQSGGLTTTTLIEGSDGRVIVDAADGTGKPINNLQLQASVVFPDQSAASRSIALEQIAPGRYQGQFPAHQRGTYLVAVSEGPPEDSQLVANSGAVNSYPPEYRDLQPNLALLENLADASSGAVLSDVTNLFQQKPYPVRSFWPLWQLLLILVTSCLLVDIAWRRLNVADWFRRRSAGPAPVAARGDAAVGALRVVKSGRRDVDSQRKTLRDRIESVAASEAVASVAGEMPRSGEPAASSSVEASESDRKSGPAVAAQESESYTHRLLSAKKRAKDQIREQS